MIVPSKFCSGSTTTYFRAGENDMMLNALLAPVTNCNQPLRMYDGKAQHLLFMYCKILQPRDVIGELQACCMQSVC